MDRTAEDIKQDERITKLEKLQEDRAADQQRYLANLAGRVKNLEAQSAGLAKELADAKKALLELEPLKKLAGVSDRIHKALGLPQ